MTVYISICGLKHMANEFYIFSECSKHCSLCYNATECYECTQGYFLNEIQECESKWWAKYGIKLYITSL